MEYNYPSLSIITSHASYHTTLSSTIHTIPSCFWTNSIFLQFSRNTGFPGLLDHTTPVYVDTVFTHHPSCVSTWTCLLYLHVIGVLSSYVQQLWSVCSVFIEHLSSVFIHYLCFVFIQHLSSVLKQNICSLYTHRLCFALIQHPCLYSHIIRVLYSYNTCTHKLSVFFIHTSYIFCFQTFLCNVICIYTAPMYFIPTTSLFCIHTSSVFGIHEHLCSAFTRHHFSRIHSQ